MEDYRFIESFVIKNASAEPSEVSVHGNGTETT